MVGETNYKDQRHVALPRRVARERMLTDLVVVREICGFEPQTQGSKSLGSHMK